MLLPDSGTLLPFMTAALARNVTLGADMLYVVARSIGEGRAAGLMSSLGIAAAGLVQTLAMTFGLGVLRGWPVAFEIVKWTGVVCLLWLGARAVRKRKDAVTTATVAAPSNVAMLFQGMLANALSPKWAAFSFVLLPQFIDAGRGPVRSQIFVFGFLFSALALLVNILVAILANGGVAWLRRPPGESVMLRRLSGVLLIALGLRLALESR
jgi:threonine/homoserine/homoserine lactone efflux protein